MLKMIKVGFALAAASLLFACGGAEDSGNTELRSRGQKLSAQQNRVLGYETPTSDWTTNNGSMTASSSDVTEGTQALEVTLNGYTQIASTNIVAPGASRSVATFDIKLAQALSWGDARLVMVVPSQGKYWSDLGGLSLAGLAPGVFHSLSFNVPQDVRAALDSSATDVSFRIVLNAQSGTNITLDNLVVSDSGDSGPTDALSTESVEFSLAIPKGSPISRYVISSTNRVTIDDRSTISEEDNLTSIANLGLGGIEIGSGVQAHSHLVSQGDVEFLRSQSHIYGSVTTGGSVLGQDHTVTVDGVITEDAAVAPAVTNWSVDWPVNVTDDISLPPDSPAIRLKPGAFDSVQVFSRTGLVLEAGKYFINSLVIEPDVNFIADVSRGPVEVYVRDTLRLRSRVLYVGGEPGQLLFGYLGQQPALFEEAVTAAVVAPNSTIELRRPNSGESHRGSFFGKEVHIFSDSVVLHAPLNWSFACPSDDFDEDGVLDCFDECWRDPDKVVPGICECGTPDTDTDGDGVPDCMDECKFDAGISTRGMCRCPSEENALPEGEPCNDGLIPGTFTCTAGGSCGPTGDELDSSRKPQDDCVLKTLGGRGFWICPSTNSGSSGASGDPDDSQGAAALCAKSPGGQLVQIGTRQENSFFASLVGGPSWIGAADFTTEGEWHWRGPDGSETTQFWTGGAAGKRFKGKFSAWANEKPVSDDGKNCATIDVDGKWRAEDCSQLRPYVCEFRFSTDYTVPSGFFFPEPKGQWEIIPGVPLGLNNLPESYPAQDVVPEPPCVNFSDIGMSEREYRERADLASKECEQNCGQDKNLDEEESQECEASHCKGAMLPPEDEGCSPVPEALKSLDFVLPGTCEVIDFADLPSDGLEGEELDAFRLAALREGQDCSGVSFPNGMLPYDVDMDLRCGVKTVCLALDSANAPRTCTQNGECSSGLCDCLEGFDCNLPDEQGNAKLKYCLDPNLANACQSAGTKTDNEPLFDGPPVDRLGADGTCVGQCFSRVGCGTTVIENGIEFIRKFYPNIIPREPTRCDEVRLCGPEPYTEDVISSEFEEDKKAFEDQPLPETADVVLPYSDDFECTGFFGCSGYCGDADPDPACLRAGRHAWCNNDVRTEGSPRHENEDSSSGKRGELTSPISFGLTPTSEMHFELEPLPYGAATFSAKASAGVRAVVDFDVLGTKGSVEVVDLKAEISASLCRASTKESKLEVVGVDFLPEIASAAIFDSDDYLSGEEEGAEKFSAKCEQAVLDYVDAFDRAKKALRDAQELITQYKAMAAEQPAKTFSADFCETVAGAGMRPPGMEGFCPEEPHEVINRFVDYYHRQIKREIPRAVRELSQSVLNGEKLGDLLAVAFPENPLAQGGPEYSFFADLGIGAEESVTLVSIQFFIGPIPCLLEVTSYVDYGIRGGFGLLVSPDTLIGGEGNFAQVGAEVGPYANSGLTLFVGAGFNFGILKLAVGVEGGVTLGHIGLPAVVSAGLKLQKSPEDPAERPAPPSLANLSTGKVLFPLDQKLKQYAYEFNYKYGIGLEVTDILTGYLDGSLKVSFAFFSKKFNQRIATFSSGLGIGPLMLISGESGSALGGDIVDDIEFEGVVAHGSPTWKQSFESIPFTEFIPLDAPDVAIQDFVQWGNDTKGRVSELLYDELCKECAPTGEHCGRDADCCTQGDACLGEGAAAVCGPPECLPSGSSCEGDSQCCDGEKCLLQSNWTKACSVPACTLGDGASCQISKLPMANCCAGAFRCAGGVSWGTCQVVVK